MAGGLVALLDDVALIARTAASSVDDVAAAATRTSAKAAGVVVDDAAVTPRFVEGVKPARELPIIWRITKGSLRNKLLIILPVALILNALAPWALTPLLMIGGLYLSFEGAEKVIELFRGGDAHHQSDQPRDEDSLVRGAITTDLILSAEIMVISLNEVADQTIWMEFAVLMVVGILITLMVYGAVAILIKMDDMGLHLTQKDSKAAKTLGRGLMAAMPKVLTALSFIGMFAMLWVGGHILVTGADTLGWHLPHHIIHSLVHHVEHIGVLAWTVETLCSLVVGLAVGAVVAVVVHAISSKRH